MTLSGMTPAEGWRLIEPGGVIQDGDEFWSSVRRKWSPVWSSVGEEIGEDHPVRRRLAPDPSAPLREELREARFLILDLHRETWKGLDARLINRIDNWVERNGGFGPGGEGK